MRDYRVRYYAKGMDAARELDTTGDDGRPVDSYKLVFWPALPAPDEVVKQTSNDAAYWHRERGSAR